MSLSDTVHPMVKFRDKGADAGEICGFCMSKMNAGSSVCTGCGADRYSEPGKFHMFLLALLGYATIASVIPLIIGLAILFGGGSKGKPISAGIFLTLFAVAIIAIFIISIRKVPLKARYYKTRH